MKSWKKRFNDELENIVPELRADVKNAPIPAGQNINYNGRNTAVKSRNKIISVIAVAVACLIALIACFVLLLPKKSGEFMFTIEINPAISMVSDGKGTVTQVISSNSDADVILSAEGVRENIIGKKVPDAAVYYADCAAKLGYINFETGGSAVRVSSYGKGKNNVLLDSAKDSLEDYFISKGVFAVVLAENVDKEQFSERSGIPYGTDESMKKYFTESNLLFSSREAEGLSLNELQDLYGKNKNLQEFITYELKQNFDKLTKNSEDIQNLFNLYFNIFNHKDNPAPSVLKGYWEVKKYYGDKLIGEFAELVAEMDTALQNYKIDYGVEITNIFQLQSVANSYLSVSIERIAELIENFSYDLFNELSSELFEIMTAAGITSESVSSLIKLPQTVEEYYAKTAALLKTEYGYRADKYKEIYGTERKPVTRAEYDGFIKNIVSQYGTLENYWQAVKN